MSSTSSSSIGQLGVGSNLDLQGLMQKLVAAEGQGETNRIDNAEAKLQKTKAALQSLENGLFDFQSTLLGLQFISAFQQMSATSSDPSTVTVQASPTAAAGAHSLEVTTLAQSQRLSSDVFTSSTDVVGTGTITIQTGTYSNAGNTFTANASNPSQTITISNSQNTLQGVRDAINAAGGNTTASIIFDGSGYRLLINAKDTGLANSLKITVSDADGTNTNTTGLSKIAYDPTAVVGSGKNLTQSVAALDAALTVDGIALTNSSNTITNVLQGVTINLLKTNVGVKNSITVVPDTSTVSSNINAFISAYNTLNTLTSQLSKYDQTTKVAGPLLGDFTLNNIRDKMKGILGSLVTPSGSGSTIRSLSSIGVKTLPDGSLFINSTILKSVLDSNFSEVGRLFAPQGLLSDSNISYIGSSKITKQGNYAINISQVGTQASLVGSAAANLTITSGVNDNLVLTVNGTPGSALLSPGTYTAASLAAEVQSKINGSSTFLSAGVQVLVSQNAGVFSINSAKYGSTSSVNINGGNGATDFLGATPVATAGVDVAGTIGAQIASGSGQTLTGAGADTSGLQLLVTGTSTGQRGSVNFTRGVADKLAVLMGNSLGIKSSIVIRLDNISTQNDRLEADRVALANRLRSIQANLIRQFSNLDNFVTKMKSDGDFLAQQFKTLNNSN